METILLLIQNYGYLFLFGATLLEGETVVALAGFTAYEGYLKLPFVIIVAILGAVVGDQAYFYFGRLKGKQFIAKRPNLSARVARVHHLIERHQNLLIFGSRFLYGFRTVIPIAIGTSNVKRTKFFLLNLLGACVWATLFSFAGFLFGTALERMLGNIQRAERYIVIGVLLGALLAQGIFFVYKRILAQVEKAEEKEEQSLDN